MPIREAHAVWSGDLKQGKGNIRFGSQAAECPYGFASRFESGEGTNPEELIAAAEAGCFSMALAKNLTDAGHPPTRIESTARVHLEKTKEGFRISLIELETSADVPGIEEQQFQGLAENAQANCPVSRALAAADITLTARLLSQQAV